jgi:hypothetical protein
MDGRRLALLIGNSRYDDPEFAPLVKPAHDVEGLAEILRDPARGGFDDVQTMVDCPQHAVKPAIERFFARKSNDDLLLLYFSGHGKRDGVDLYFAMPDTAADALDSTAIEAAFVSKQIDKSYSNWKVIILDCCHSGAFLPGTKGAALNLPSEAEWEYACRAGTTTPFYCGETITTDLANYHGNYAYGSGPKGAYREQTTDVGSFPPNTFGVYDMHGNVWEWCQDVWHENYEGAPDDGSVWESGVNARYRLLRGGAWGIYPHLLRCANRNWVAPDVQDGYVGFRLVVSSASWALR